MITYTRLTCHGPFFEIAITRKYPTELSNVPLSIYILFPDWLNHTSLSKQKNYRFACFSVRTQQKSQSNKKASLMPCEYFSVHEHPNCS